MNELEQRILSRPVTRWGKLMYQFFPYRKKVVLANIQQAFGEKISPTAQRHLAKAFYSHLGKILQETWRLRFLSEKQLIDSVSIDQINGLKNLENLLSKIIYQDLWSTFLVNAF